MPIRICQPIQTDLPFKCEARWFPWAGDMSFWIHLLLCSWDCLIVKGTGLRTTLSKPSWCLWKDCSLPDAQTCQRNQNTDTCPNTPAVENHRKGPLQVHRGLVWVIGCLMNLNGGLRPLHSSGRLQVHHPPARCGPTGSIRTARDQGSPPCGMSNDYTASSWQSCI